MTNAGDPLNFHCRNQSLVKKTITVSLWKLTERGLWMNKLSKSLISNVRPIANIMRPSDKLYDPGPLFTNHANADGLKQATMPPTVTYRGYKLAAVDITFSHLGFVGVTAR